MDMQGTRQLGVTQEQAWEALNDPETLKGCLPGCDKFESTGDNQYAVTMAVKVGPVSGWYITPPHTHRHARRPEHRDPDLLRPGVRRQRRGVGHCE